MAGHSKWKQIKHKKTLADQAKSRLFSKLTNIITVAAKEGVDPQFNPALRNAIEQAKRHNLPQANIERAISRATSAGHLSLIVVEAYGPEGAGIIVEAVTDNRNRTINELRSIFKKYDTKMAEPGSVSWSFEKTTSGYRPKFKSAISESAREKLKNLTQTLEAREDIKGIYLAVDG